MNEALNIVPECFVDTILVETLLDLNHCNHQNGVNNVLRIIETKLKDTFAIGIIDNDKRKPSGFDEYVKIAGSNHIQIYKNQKKPYHLLLIIDPAQEVFILDNVSAANIQMAEYGLPDNLVELKKRTKSVMSKRDSALRKLFKALSEVGEVNKIKAIFEYLDKIKYQYEETVLHELLS